MKLRHAMLTVATVLAATQASAITYTGTRTVGTASAALSITTDDTIGALERDNIVDWTIGLTQGSNQFTLTSANSQLLLVGSALVASTTSLSFDFSAASISFALFQAPNIGSADTFYCVETAGCSGNGQGETVLATTEFDDNSFAARTGVIVLATAENAVPEPASWGMMLVGFGLIGAAARRRRTARALTA